MTRLLLTFMLFSIPLGLTASMPDLSGMKLEIRNQVAATCSGEYIFMDGYVDPAKPLQDLYSAVRLYTPKDSRPWAVIVFRPRPMVYIDLDRDGKVDFRGGEKFGLRQICRIFKFVK